MMPLMSRMETVFTDTPARFFFRMGVSLTAFRPAALKTSEKGETEKQQTDQDEKIFYVFFHKISPVKQYPLLNSVRMIVLSGIAVFSFLRSDDKCARMVVVCRLGAHHIFS